jgi:hypothetical protein
LLRDQPPLGSSKEQVSAWLSSFGIRHKYRSVRRDPITGEFDPSIRHMDMLEDDAFKGRVEGCIFASILDYRDFPTLIREVVDIGFLFDKNGKLIKSRIVFTTIS